MGLEIPVGAARRQPLPAGAGPAPQFGLPEWTGIALPLSGRIVSRSFATPGFDRPTVVFFAAPL